MQLICSGEFTFPSLSVLLPWLIGTWFPVSRRGFFRFPFGFVQIVNLCGIETLTFIVNRLGKPSQFERQYSIRYKSKDRWIALV